MIFISFLFIKHISRVDHINHTCGECTFDVIISKAKKCFINLKAKFKIVN